MEFYATPDACLVCRALLGKVFEPHNAPVIPVPNCTNAACRCDHLPAAPGRSRTNWQLRAGGVSKLGTNAGTQLISTAPVQPESYLFLAFLGASQPEGGRPAEAEAADCTHASLAWSITVPAPTDARMGRAFRYDATRRRGCRGSELPIRRCACPEAASWRGE